MDTKLSKEMRYNHDEIRVVKTAEGGWGDKGDILNQSMVTPCRGDSWAGMRIREEYG